MSAIISLIVAMTPEGLIGGENKLLWHLPNDLKHFKALTMGKPIIMGRKTFESIGKPLPGRKNIIISRQAPPISGCELAHSVEQALSFCQPATEIMVIGGGEIYRLFLPLATRIFATYVVANLAGDTYFPPLSAEWQEIAREDHKHDEKHGYDYSFVTLIKQR